MKHQFEIESYSFRESGFYSELICDYTEANNKVKHLLEDFPSLEALLQLAKTRDRFPINRQQLCDAIKKQYEQSGAIGDKVKHQLTLLREDHTYTVTTGHQLNIFGGPLYLVYKVIDVLKLAHKLNVEDAERNYVPVFWMASEDHDLEEITHCRLKGNQLEWNTSQTGAVGRMHLNDFAPVLDAFIQELGLGVEADYLKQLFIKAYNPDNTLAQATRSWIAELFKDTELLIVDGDDPSLKQCFVPIMRRELEQQLVQSSSQQTNGFLDQHYHVQVNPRAINLFYLQDGRRDRIVESDKGYALTDNSLQWSKEELFSLLEQHPEYFSPNALMRPMYQECILPNISYSGGGGEIAYWLQLKSSFEAFGLSFPILLVRNSWHFAEQKVFDKLSNLGVAGKSVFKDRSQWEAETVSRKFKEDLSLKEYEEAFEKAILGLRSLADKWGADMVGAVDAEEAKLQRSFKRLAKKMRNAAKRKNIETIEMYHRWMDVLWSNNGLQERVESFSTLYFMYGENWLSFLMEHTEPIQTKFNLVKTHSTIEKP